jgi:hypothetical protein
MNKHKWIKERRLRTKRNQINKRIIEEAHDSKDAPREWNDFKT